MVDLTQIRNWLAGLGLVVTVLGIFIVALLVSIDIRLTQIHKALAKKSADPSDER
jgi:hypothetical protein